MGNCLSKKKRTEETMGSSFSSSKGSIEVAKKSENLSLIQNDQSSGPKETTLKTIKQQHMDKVLDSAEQMIENETFSNKPVIKLLPHQHTLFCERKQRVCTSVGRLQEYETLQIEGNIDNYFSFVWVRRPPTAINSPDHSADEIIESSENEVEYKLTKRDVGMHICVCLTKVDPTPAGDAAAVPSSSGGGVLYTASLGPVLPGPPRILDFTVTGSLEVGTAACASYEYIGGFEGVSEVWWMRIRPDGKREQITSETAAGEEAAVATATNNNKEYVLTAEDVGCTLKAKCRPVRSDGVKGEIFTSKSSEVVVPTGGTAAAAAAAAASTVKVREETTAESEVMDVEEQEEQKVVVVTEGQREVETEKEQQQGEGEKEEVKALETSDSGENNSSSAVEETAMEVEIAEEAAVTATPPTEDAAVIEPSSNDVTIDSQ